MEREGHVLRETKETKIEVRLCLDGKGDFEGTSGLGFFDHMLELMTKHGLLNLSFFCEGDLTVDGHHTVEDMGICIGKAFFQALGDRKSIKRYSTFHVPMDEALAMVTIDLSGRPYLQYNAPMTSPMIGDLDSQLLEEFFRSIAVHSRMTLHIHVVYGSNSHHMAEAIFKAFGRALDEASSIDERIMGVPSTKGILD